MSPSPDFNHSNNIFMGSGDEQLGKWMAGNKNPSRRIISLRSARRKIVVKTRRRHWPPINWIGGFIILLSHPRDRRRKTLIRRFSFESDETEIFRNQLIFHPPQKFSQKIAAESCRPEIKVSTNSSVTTFASVFTMSKSHSAYQWSTFTLLALRHLNGGKENCESLGRAFPLTIEHEKEIKNSKNASIKFLHCDDILEGLWIVCRVSRMFF